MTDEPRFTAMQMDGGWVVHDAQRMTVARIHEAGPMPAEERARRMASRMNDKTDTPTGYVWE